MTDRLGYERFFDKLTPRLETARVLEQNLDRELARRFNVFDCLRPDEQRLSEFVAALLNPKGKHGQGLLFLRILLKELRPFPTLDIGGEDSRRISVVTERRITNQRRIDVSVDITAADGQQYCLAIENKPWAGDQENQVKEYLEFLEQRYGERFMLIYLSPGGHGPSDWSIPRAALDQWRGRFAIQAYYERRVESEEPGESEKPDDFETFRKSYSLVDWLGDCRKHCDVERLRWLLNEAEQFCRLRFGGHTMTVGSEREAIRDFVLGDAGHVETARAVQEAWPEIRDDVCSKFLEAVRRRIESRATEELKDVAGSIRVGCQYDGKKQWTSAVCLFSEHWKQYNDAKTGNNHAKDADGRTSIRMQANKGVNGWHWGIASPKNKRDMEGADKERRVRLDEKIKNEFGGKPDAWWSFIDWVGQDKGDWEPLVPRLHRECKEGKGELIEYYADRFIEIAKRAVPIINAIDG